MTKRSLHKICGQLYETLAKLKLFLFMKLVFEEFFKKKKNSLFRLFSKSG